MKRTRPKRSQPLPRPLEIPGVMDLATLADVRALLGHLSEVTRARDTWQHVEAELKKAEATGDTMQVSIVLRMVLQLEKVEYRKK